MRIPILSAVGRRSSQLGALLAFVLLAGAAVGIEAQQPAARVFTGDAGLIFNVIKADKTADFEAVVAKLKESLQKSSDEARKKQAASWKVYKQVEPGPNGSVLYVFVIDPAVKGADYTVSKILYEAFPNEAQDLFKKYSDSYAGGVSLSNLMLVSTFVQ